MSTQTIRQNDFSGGQVNQAAWRKDDDPNVRSGARKALNWRVEATKQLVPRPGRRPVMPGLPREDYIRMTSGNEFLIGFGAGSITIATLAGAIVATNSSSAYLWTNATVGQIVFCQGSSSGLDNVIITFPSMRPQVATWNAASGTWSFAPFAFSANGPQLNEPFYRFSVLGATMAYSGVTGAVNLTCSVAYFTAAMVGSILSVLGQQVQILSITSSTVAVVNVLYQLPGAITVPVASVAALAPGQVVTATSEGFKFEVSSVSASGLTVTGLLTSDIVFQSIWNGKDASGNDDILVSPLGSSSITSAPSAASLPQTTVQWQEEFMSAQSGWPSSCFYDRQRVGFCGFPQKRNAILWGAINDNFGFWIDSIAAANQPEAGSAADAAMLEFVTDSKGKAANVSNVIGWGDEFVFTDRGIFQVPISVPGNPLQPGSVEFRQFSNDACSTITPVPLQDAIIYINAGLNRCSVVRATGAYSRPYITQDVSDLYTDLFKSPVTFGVTTGDGTFPERYIYVVNGDGSLAIGKFTPNDTFVGWMPWKSAASVAWVTVADSEVYYTTAYGLNFLVELEDVTLYQDATIPLNAVPTQLIKPGFGTFWFWPSATVTLIDGDRDLGDRQTNAMGNIIPIPGEDLSSLTLTGGVFSPCLWQPLVPTANSGQTAGQGRRLRKIARAVAHVEESSGFRLGSRLFPCDKFGADATAQPILVAGAFRTSTVGRSQDPTIEFAKDRPGPLRLKEFVTEATI